MARAFASGSSQYLEIASAVVSAMPLTMACWFNPTDRSADYELMCIGEAAGTDEYRLELRPNVPSASSFTLQAAVLGGSFQRQSRKAAYSSGAWQHACGVYTSTASVDVYLDAAIGSQGNSGGDPTTPSGTNRTSVGRIPRTTPIFYLNGQVGEAAIWSAALDAAEVAALAAGVSPLLVRPASLVAYWPLIGQYSPEIDVRGRNELTVTGATTAAHPRVIYPQQSRPRFVPAAASIRSPILCGGLLRSGIIAPVGAAGGVL